MRVWELEKLVTCAESAMGGDTLQTWHDKFANRYVKVS